MMHSADRDQRRGQGARDAWPTGFTDDAGPWGRGPWRHRPRDPDRLPWIPVVVAVVLQFPLAVFSVHQAWADGGTTWPRAAAVVVALGASFLLLLVPRHPGPAVIAIAVVCAPAIGLTSGPPSPALPLAVAVILGIVRGARVWVWSTVAGFAIAAPVFSFAVTGMPTAIIRPLIVALVLCLLMGIGEVVRNRRERFAQARREAAARRQSAAEAERTRIARELHDVLAHSLSQITVQAGMGLHLFDTQPDRARDALAAIRTTSNQALEEVRGVLGFLRSDADGEDRAPLPDLERLPALAESFRSGGMEVSLDNGLKAGLSQALQLTLYRVVQEALTNSARHGAARHARVALSDIGGTCLITIEDDGRGAAAAAQPGRGLTGMRERVELLGGSIQTESPSGGGFRVAARIPLPGTAYAREGAPA
jgi:signal transduction histidine kinase